MGNLGFEEVKESRNLGITLEKLKIIVIKSKKLLQMGSNRGSGHLEIASNLFWYMCTPEASKICLRSSIYLRNNVYLFDLK